MTASARTSRRHHPVLAYRRDLAAIFVGGCIGAVVRVALSEAFPADPGQWPWATLAANLIGAFALGAINTVLPPAAVGRPLLGTGFCGALTTFSALQLEVLRMLEAGEGGRAVVYVSVSVVAGLLAVTMATVLVRRWSAEQ
jgi:CrcB protein